MDTESEDLNVKLNNISNKEKDNNRLQPTFYTNAKNIENTNDIKLFEARFFRR